MNAREHLLPYARRADFHVGRATELKGSDYRLYRALEILPGFLSWATLLLIIVLAAFAPFVASYFVLAYSIFWLLKTVFMSMHLRANWRRMRHNLKVDWGAQLENLKYEHLQHAIILPFYKEGEEIIRQSLDALTKVKYDAKKFIVVLAGEGRAGKEYEDLARHLAKEYSPHFRDFIVTTHPADVPGEVAGKGSNAAYAAEILRTQILDPQRLKYDEVIVSIFDVDTVVYPDYFNCLTWHFLTAEHPLKSSFQPVPLFNNNLWDAPAVSRVMAMSSSFWQMIQQERPEKMGTFSSHAMSFQALYEVGYWQTNMVSEDSRIHFNLLMANHGNYNVVPLAYPVSMDANVADSFWQTIVNIYKQHRRWTYGVESVPYLIYHAIKNKQMPLGKRIMYVGQQIEGFWSLATAPLILFILGWAPMFLGGDAYHATVVSYNLPIIARDILTLAMAGLIISAMISISLLPPRPKDKSRFMYVVMALQWIMVPITMNIFSSIPGLEAQTRLMFGKYMGFWVTPKKR
ncbi:hypothetical protein A3C87_02560 [Candidatus Kaiserbacteria bacterium RIFCSPHIGHO2_02_FULL_49_34]|uniref:Glycosyltransferase 2-like domain-containing protein n=1 Tax=Candidatus Kaiserbacteria bacterium RIFCSPHIGHO2_02_FULL_49_34 TaxID=1798491 RepID=A0A1F6DLG7_9BACT|nr:MAG: hypothetical protein A3C87_02560 [Candidatus Kaiserbacteria bacterium RIFCSPHIGHO2_02_FULL_49_34]